MLAQNSLVPTATGYIHTIQVVVVVSTLHTSILCISIFTRDKI